jgi:hypothetical protein
MEVAPMPSAILPPPDQAHDEDLATLRDMVMSLLDENAWLRSSLDTLRESNAELSTLLERARAAARNGRPRARD